MPTIKTKKKAPQKKQMWIRLLAYSSLKNSLQKRNHAAIKRGEKTKTLLDYMDEISLNK